MAEWSKAVLSGSILHWRRFESCCYYPFLIVWVVQMCVRTIFDCLVCTQVISDLQKLSIM